MTDLAAADGKPRAASSRTAEAKLAWRAHERQRSSLERAVELKIGIAASFTPNNLVPFLGNRLVQAGTVPGFVLGPYNQLIQVCLDPTMHVGADCAAILLLWRIEDLLQDEALAYLRADSAALGAAAAKLDTFAAAIARLRDVFQGAIIAGVPPFPIGLGMGLYGLDAPTAMGAFHRAIVEQWTRAMSSIGDIRLVDLDGVQRHVGAMHAYDARQHYLYRQPFTDGFLHELSDRISRIIVAARTPAKKCVVLDCDNTLWGGIIGEDGLDGIQIGDDYPGFAYRDFQRLLLTWRAQGTLLAIASKNNEADVWEVFDKHDGMLLKREHLSAWAINWSPKPENIPAIAAALNIGIDSLVFIDDNPMEIDYMRQAQPSVTSIQLPDDPAEIVGHFQGLTLFDKLVVTEEDRQRADMMRAEQVRNSLNTQLSKGEFQRALGLRIEFSVAKPEDLGRVTQLINKTNQFNLTTIRRTLEDVRVLAQSDSHRIYALRVADKFGEYGLTGVVVIDRTKPGEWLIDTLLMSCRVLGRGVETSLLASLADDARADAAHTVSAHFVPTSKNALARDFLPDHGFEQTTDGTWRIAIAAIPPLPDFVVRS